MPRFVYLRVCAGPVSLPSVAPLVTGRVLLRVTAPGGGLRSGSAPSVGRTKRLEGGVQGPDKGPGRDHPLRHGPDCQLKELPNWEDQRLVE